MLSRIGYRGCYSWTRRGDGCHQDGWGICSWGARTKEPWYGWGVYKITYLGNGDYFYIDFRDDNYAVIGSDYGGTDLYVYYIEDHFEWFPVYDYENLQPINNGQVIRIWERRNNYIPETSGFPYFWKNCLVLVPSFYDNPLLIWGPNPDLENILGYKIYRAIYSVPNPKPKVYSLIATVDDTTFYYIDYDVRLDEDGDYIWYYLKAYNSQTESLGSNVVTTNGGLYKKNNFDKFSSTDYSLNQNFPNPFNPETRIDYSIKESGFVSLRVYDTIGNEIATLVNEYKPAGSHDAEFNAAQLPSGVYFYQLKAGSYMNTKKMILIK